jgi:thymidylate kinase
VIIIVEGPRGVGKTTLCQALVDRLNEPPLREELASIGFNYDVAVYFKASRGADPVADMVASIESQLETPNVVYVWDRGPLTEWVMSTLNSRVPALDLTVGIEFVLTKLVGQNAVIVYLHVPKRILRQRLAGREGDRRNDFPTVRGAVCAWDISAAYWAAKFPFIVRYSPVNAIQLDVYSIISACLVAARRNHDVQDNA